MQYDLIITGTIGNRWESLSPDYVRYELNKKKDKEVHVGFCSLGGYVHTGLELNQAFRDHGNVHAHAFGCNASISTVAMLGCKTIDIVKGSFFLIHNTSQYIEVYEQANKEQIASFISSLQNISVELKTFDEVLASLYADKTGKSMEECAAQMKKGNWMSAQQALDFGLVDSIREDEKEEKAANQYNLQFKNSYSTDYKDAGIPPLPTGEERQATAAIVDGNGEPTPNFLQKTWQGLQGLIRNNHAIDTPINNMIKIFNYVMDLLALTDGFQTQDDGSINLTQEQMKTVDDRLGELENQVKDNAKAMTEAANTIKELRAYKEQTEIDLAEKDEQIKALQGSAGADTKDVISEGDGAISAQDLFNILKNV